RGDRRGSPGRLPPRSLGHDQRQGPDLRMRRTEASTSRIPSLRRMATVGSPELMIVMGAHATSEQVDEVVARLEEAGAQAHVTPGKQATVIGVIGEREHLAALPLEGYPGVEQVLPILKPYKLVSRELSPDPTVIEV